MTEFVIGGRATGKTQEALRWVRGAGNRYLIVPDAQQASGVLATDAANCARLGGMPLHAEKVMPYGSRRRLGQTVELGVDNIDMLLREIFLAPVSFVTATGSLHGGPLPSNQIIIGGSA